MGGGQMSPWILEAEALVNGEDDLVYESPGSGKALAAWGMAPSCLEQIPELPGLKAEIHSEPHPRSLSKEFATIEDDDELNHVNMFITTDAAAAAQRCIAATKGDADELDRLTGTSESTAAPTSTSSPLSSASAGGDRRAPVKPEPIPRYAPGDLVKYWSGSHGMWLPARIVEPRSRSIYLIDKQMKGCFSKVRASDLVSDVEERRDPILRACVALEREAEPAAPAKRPAPQYANLPSQTLPRTSYAAQDASTPVQQTRGR